MCSGDAIQDWHPERPLARRLKLQQTDTIHFIVSKSVLSVIPERAISVLLLPVIFDPPFAQYTWTKAPCSGFVFGQNPAAASPSLPHRCLKIPGRAAALHSILGI